MITPNGSHLLGYYSISDGANGYQYYGAASTIDGSIQPLGENFFPTATNADGSLIFGPTYVGESRTGYSQWTPEGGLSRLSIFDEHPDRWSIDDVSYDGKVLAGTYYDGERAVPYRWSDDRGFEFAGLEPCRGTQRVQISGNGDVLGFGTRNICGGAIQGELFQWYSDGRLEMIPVQEPFGGSVQAISYDGSAMIGGFWHWRDGSDWSRLPSRVNATAMSADGGLVVGEQSDFWNEQRWAIVWDEVHGMRNLQPLLTARYDLDELLDGWELTTVQGITADGRTMFGYARNFRTGGGRTWVATIPEPPTIVLSAMAVLLIGPWLVQRVRRRRGETL